MIFRLLSQCHKSSLAEYYCDVVRKAIWNDVVRLTDIKFSSTTYLHYKHYIIQLVWMLIWYRHIFSNDDHFIWVYTYQSTVQTQLTLRSEFEFCPGMACIDFSSHWYHFCMTSKDTPHMFCWWHDLVGNQHHRALQ